MFGKIREYTSGDIPKNYVVTNFKSVIFVSISCVPISVTFWATMTMKWSKTISWIGRINWYALKVCAQRRAQKLRLIFYMKSYKFVQLKCGLGVVKSMDNLLNFCHLIMMRRENPFYIDKIIRFWHHETRARALVRAKYR